MCPGEPALRPIPATRVDGSVESDLRELRAVLTPQSFPTDQDHLLARCVAGRTPSRLLRRLACLNRGRAYASIDEVCREVAQFAAAHRPLPGA